MKLYRGSFFLLNSFWLDSHLLIELEIKTSEAILLHQFVPYYPVAVSTDPVRLAHSLSVLIVLQIAGRTNRLWRIRGNDEEGK